MPTLRFTALRTDIVNAYRIGSPDANGRPAERGIAGKDGGLPCRHCLRDITAGEAYLLLAHRPFDGTNPYAEIGPVFLHAAPCVRYEADEVGLPEILAVRPQVLVRGYDADDRIVYGTGRSIPTDDLTEYAEVLLARPEIAYLHLRSAANSCFTCRVDRH